jgi:hypothetical protein
MQPCFSLTTSLFIFLNYLVVLHWFVGLYAHNSDDTVPLNRRKSGMSALHIFLHCIILYDLKSFLKYLAVKYL